MRQISTGAVMVILLFVIGFQLGSGIINSMHLTTAVWGDNKVYDFQQWGLVTTADLNQTNLSYMYDYSSDYTGCVTSKNFDFGGFTLFAMANNAINFLHMISGGILGNIYQIIVDFFPGSYGATLIAVAVETGVDLMAVIFALMLLTGRTVWT